MLGCELRHISSILIGYTKVLANMRFVEKLMIGKAIESFVYKYRMVPNLTYAWNFGSFAAFFLGVQIVTGVLLAMHYTPDTATAFLSVEHIMRDVNNGWLIRYAHSNGASFFFLMVYLHMWRSIYYESYGEPRLSVWFVGMIIYVLMMATAFLGYILPWGQMSLWGATVITSLFTAVPFIGNELVLWLWGGFGVGGPTLNRFYSLHYLLPMLLAACAILHLILLHDEGSNNPLGIPPAENFPDAQFHPYYVWKDFVGFVACLSLYGFFIFYYPNALGDTDNYIPANALVTPTHIVPEWYFLPFYAILRSIPNKYLGIVCMALAILVFFVLPFLHMTGERNVHLSTPFHYLFWIFNFIWIGLLWIGMQPAAEPYITCGQYLTCLYFAWFLIAVPLNGLIFGTGYRG